MNQKIQIPLLLVHESIYNEPKQVTYYWCSVHELWLNKWANESELIQKIQIPLLLVYDSIHNGPK